MKKILQQYQELLEQVDGWFSRSTELYRDKVSCRSGCSACCRSLFDITLLDAYYLKQGFDGGELMHDDWCTLNFVDGDPLELGGLSAPFDAMFRQEVALFRDFTGELLKKRMSELDTFIPTALLVQYESFDWQSWLGDFKPHDDEA